MKLWDASKDARLSVAGEIIYLALGYGVTLLIARVAGPRALGIYAISLTALNIGEICCAAGLKQASLRYIPLYVKSGQSGLVRGIVLFATRMSGLLGVAIGVILFGLSPILTRYLFTESLLSDALRVVALVLPLFALRGVWSYALQGFQATKYRVLVEKLLEPGIRLMAVGLFLLFGLRLLGGILAITIAVLGSTVAAFYFLQKLMAPIVKEEQPRYEVRTWLSYSVPLLFQSLAVFLQPAIPLLVIEHFQGSSQVGIFSAALKVATLVSLPLIALNTVFAPRISEVSSRREIGGLGSLYRMMTVSTISMSLLPFLISLLFASPIMQIFGPEFEAGSSILGLLAVGYLVRAISGPAGCVLVMTGRVNISLVNALLGSLLSLLLNLLLVPSLGLRGAAIASTITLVVVGILGLAQVFYFLRIQPYGRASLRPVLAGVIATIGLLLLSRQGIWFLQIFLFIVAYLGLFWLFTCAGEKDWMQNISAVVRGTIRFPKPK